ncbi:MAG: hypothetical protein K2M12_03410 [Muribaculaceae bacterium]|nr:hypothetical protein [Muribaculaceae bacterium]
MVYYSQTGATKAGADELQKQLGCDIVAIEAVEPYDCDYPSTIARWRSEVENGVKVGINPIEINFDKYNTIFLGFPIWGGNYASPVATFLEDNSLAGKKVVTFATFGSGGIDGATKNVAAAQPEAEVVQGYGVRNARVAKAPAEIVRFLVENGYKDGEVEAMPAYSESKPVTDKETAIFNEACGSYQFPLGTPVEVASRKTPAGMDYKFAVESQTPDGQKAASTIYVTVEDGSAPEFTEVVRH